MLWILPKCSEEGKGVFGCSELRLKWEVLKTHVKESGAIGNAGVIQFLVSAKCDHCVLQNGECKVPTTVR